MKKIVVISFNLLLFSFICVKPLQAQIFKKLLNTVKNTSENRVNDKAAQATNSVIDKATTKKKAKTSSSNNNESDQSATGQVLGSFAKAAEQNPNDTSSADLAMKGLNILVGGEGVSAADSATAIKSFMKAKGGSGYYYETTTSVITNKRSANAINKFYLTMAGEGRVEMNMAAMMGIQGGTAIVGLSRASEPGYSLFLDDEEKTFSLNVINAALINSGHEKYKVTKIGNETINGYPCIHSKLTASGLSKMDMDIWTSKNVPGYSIMEKAMAANKSAASPAMLNALKEAGADGYFVKMLTKSKNISSEVTLTKVEQKTFPASLFEIPAGYKNAAGNGVINNLMKNAQKTK